MARPEPSRILVALSGPVIGANPGRHWEYVVAVDGGGNHLFSWNLPASLLVGDLDSITPEARSFHERHWAEIREAPREKDETDLEIAFGLVTADPTREVYLPGLCGGRTDHAIMNLLCLTRWTDRGLLTFPTPDGCGGILGPGQLLIHARKGLPAALIALSTSAERVGSQGVHWPLVGENLPFGFGRGISNCLRADTWSLTLANGVLMWLLIGADRAEIEIEWHPAGGDHR